MALDVEFRSLEEWPDEPTKRRRRSPFRANWSQTLDLLDTELSKIRKPHTPVVIEIDLPESQIRQDGWPYANATPRSPGVILNVETKKAGHLRFPCDTFESWQDNMRAIGLGLNSLRRVDRYGITRRGEQYTGWKRLPPAGRAPAPADAARVVTATAGRGIQDDVVEAVLLGPDFARQVYREALRHCHPDAGGDPQGDAFKRLQEAWAVVQKHHQNRR